MKESIRSILKFRGINPTEKECDVLEERWNNILIDKKKLNHVSDINMFFNYTYKSSDIYE